MALLQGSPPLLTQPSCHPPIDMFPMQHGHRAFRLIEVVFMYLSIFIEMIGTLMLQLPALVLIRTISVALLDM